MFMNKILDCRILQYVNLGLPKEDQQSSCNDGSLVKKDNQKSPSTGIDDKTSSTKFIYVLQCRNLYVSRTRFSKFGFMIEFEFMIAKIEFMIAKSVCFCCFLCNQIEFLFYSPVPPTHSA